MLINFCPLFVWNSSFSFRANNDSAVNQLSNDEELLLNQLITNEKETKTKFRYKNEYYLVPNPANTFVSIISNNESENLYVTITDVNGKILKALNTKSVAYNSKIDLNLLEGIYFVNVLNEQGEKTVKKLVVAK